MSEERWVGGCHALREALVRDGHSVNECCRSCHSEWEDYDNGLWYEYKGDYYEPVCCSVGMTAERALKVTP